LIEGMPARHDRPAALAASSRLLIRSIRRIRFNA
jgi:hypothetical protein